MLFKICYTFFLCWLLPQILGQSVPLYELNVAEADNKYLPIMIYKSKLVVEDHIMMSPTDTIILSCPGEMNYIQTINEQTVEATCLDNNILQIHNEEVDFFSLQCNEDPKSTVKWGTECANGYGQLKDIGFEIPIKASYKGDILQEYAKNIDVTLSWTKKAQTENIISNKNANAEDKVEKKDITVNVFFRLITVCYDFNDATTYYTEHDLAFFERVSDSKSTGMSKKGANPEVNYNKIYTQKSQQEQLNSKEKDIIYEDHYFQKGHLSPVADFLIESHRTSTNYYINIVPQWNKVNTLNWSTMEEIIRKFSKKIERTLKIITGTYSDIFNDLYLSSDQKLLLVPQVLWKIVYDEKSSEGIAFIVINDIDISKVPDHFSFCEDSCYDYGWAYESWMDDRWRDFARGYTYCCSITDLIDNVKTVPSLLDKGILYNK